MSPRPAPWPPLPSRREVLRGLAAALAAWQLEPPAVHAASSTADGAPSASVPEATQATLEAFADSLVPGEKRDPRDRAVAGVVQGPGAVQAGVVALLTMREAEVHRYLPVVATLLDTQATAFAARLGDVALDPAVPPFVALDFAQRSALCADLLAPGGLVDEDQQLLTLFALLVFTAFHTAGHRHTTAAAATHPGLGWLSFPQPDDDGVWRYPVFSYGRPLAEEHPGTSPTGHPR